MNMDICPYVTDSTLKYFDKSYRSFAEVQLNVFGLTIFRSMFCF